MHATLERPTTLGRDLERRRAAHRARRIALVLAQLRMRADEHRRTRGEVPLALRQSMADFAEELADLRRAARR